MPRQARGVKISQFDNEIRTCSFKKAKRLQQKLLSRVRCRHCNALTRVQTCGSDARLSTCNEQ